MRRRSDTVSDDPADLIAAEIAACTRRLRNLNNYTETAFLDMNRRLDELAARLDRLERQRPVDPAG